MEVVDTFIETYNQYLQRKTHFYNDVKFISRNNVDLVGEDEIEYLMTCFKFPNSYLYSGFVFKQHARSVSKTHILFADHVDYSLGYIQHKKTGNISLWNYEDQQIAMECSHSGRAFFKAMKIVLEVKMKLVEHAIEFNDHELDPDFLFVKFKACMQLNDNNNSFSDFYSYILNIDIEKL